MINDIVPAKHKVPLDEEAYRKAWKKIVIQRSHWTVKEFLLVIEKSKEDLIKYLDLKEPFDDQTLLKDLK